MSINYLVNSRLEGLWTYPAAFSGDANTRTVFAILPYLSVDHTGGISQASPVTIRSSPTSATSVTVAVWANSGFTYTPDTLLTNVRVAAIGRWF